MVQKIVSAGSPVLRQVSKPVAKIDKKILRIIKDLKDTLAVQTDPEGVGLAAPQIGKNLRIFIVAHKSLKKVVVNPEVLKIEKVPARNAKHSAAGGKRNIMEGCLSLPYYYGPLKRAERLKVKYLNEKAQEVVEEFKGFGAQIILHEIDHLNGILFVDRILEQKKKLYKLTGNEWEEVDLIK